MAFIRITKEFNFEMAHALWNYDGLCKNIHGHSYKFFVTIIGEPISDHKSPKNGMVMDFGHLKQIVNSEIIEKLDHAVVLNKNASYSDHFFENQMFGKKILVNYQPTCENLVVEFAEKIKKKLPPSLKLYSLKLYETSTSYAEWFASDNM